MAAIRDIILLDIDSFILPDAIYGSINREIEAVFINHIGRAEKFVYSYKSTEQSCNRSHFNLLNKLSDIANLYNFSTRKFVHKVEELSRVEFRNNPMIYLTIMRLDKINNAIITILEATSHETKI